MLKISRTTKASIPSEEVNTAMVLKRPFTLNNAVKNDPISSDIIITMSHESGKGLNTCGIIKPNMINAMSNTNEIMPKYLFIVSASLLSK